MQTVEGVEGKFKKEFCFFFVCYIWRFFIMLQYQRANTTTKKIMKSDKKWRKTIFDLPF